MIVKNADAVVKFFIDLSNKDAIKGISKVETKSEALAKKFNQAGKALTIGLTTPIIAFGTYATKTAADFDKASNQMQSSLGLTTKEAKQYDEVMRNIYNANYGESYEDVANSISTVKQTLDDLNPEEIEKVTESAITLRDTFDIEVNESIRATKALMDNFGTTSDESMNLLVQGFQNGLNYSDEFIDNINEYSVQFKKLGFSAQDMFNIFQSGADAGAWNLDKIGDAVKEFSIRAIDGSETTIDGFERLGMNADEMARKFASGGDVAKNAFYEVIDAIGAMDDPVQQSIVGVDLFGTMWEDLGPEVVTQLGSIKNAYDQTNNSMDEMKNIKYDDLGSMLESLKREFSDIALDVGNELMPAIQSFVGGLRDLVNAYKNLNPETKALIGNIVKVAAVIGPLLITISKLIKIGKSIKDFFNLFKNGQKVLSMLKMGGVGLAITAVAAAILLLIKNWDKIKETVGNVWNSIKNFFSNVGNAISEIIESIKTVLSEIWNSIVSFFSTIGNAIGSFFQMILTYLQLPIQFVTNVFLLIVAIVTIFLETIYNVIIIVIQTILNVIGTIVSFIYNNVLMPIFNFFSSIFTAIYNTIAGFVSMVINIFSTIAGWIYNNVLLPIFNFFSSIFNGIWNVISGVIDWIKNGFSSAADFVKNIFSKVKDFISTLFSTVANIIKAPINGLIGLVNGVIKGLNKIKIPDWVPGLGGKGINIPLIPKLAAGTNYVAGEGLAYLHEGEAVVPKKYNPAIGGYGNYNQPVYVNVIADMDVNKFGKAFVRDLKTFSGGAKNSYNYGGAR